MHPGMEWKNSVCFVYKNKAQEKNIHGEKLSWEFHEWVQENSGLMRPEHEENGSNDPKKMLNNKCAAGL